ncbi:HGxxPAAW family protein [Streptomyces sp. 4N509B]|uniref:HGxxPAAW family protein n=1 Tax=Streptomyces sp. 4N509B TaxID=3457413 RepID=UPI003FD2B1CD
MAGKHYHHGNSPAAWTGVIIIMIGFCVGSAFTVMAEPLGVAGGAVIAGLGVVIGLVMRSMGLGQAPAGAPLATRAGTEAEAGAATTTETTTEIISGGRAEPQSATVGG